jgi:chloramphenicol 3-O-phosphotransferase
MILSRFRDSTNVCRICLPDCRVCLSNVHVYQGMEVAAATNRSADRKLNRRRDDLCAGALRKRVLICHRDRSYHFVIGSVESKELESA